MDSIRTRVNARLPNGHPREEKRTSDKSRPELSRGVGPRAPRQTRRLPREDPRAEVGQEVRVGVGVRVGPVELAINKRTNAQTGTSDSIQYTVCGRPINTRSANNFHAHNFHIRCFSGC